MRRLGAITVGQSPRVDIMPDLVPLLPDVEVLQRGALDDYSDAELDELMARRTDPILATRRRDGREILVGERDVMAGLRAGVEELGDSSVEAILLLCTGTFPTLESRARILYPEHLLSHFVSGVCARCVVGVMTPAEAQIPFQLERWAKTLGGEDHVRVAYASPYAADADGGVVVAGRELAEKGSDMIVMDCLGYTREMRALVREELGNPVVLARTVLARAAAELLGV